MAWSTPGSYENQKPSAKRVNRDGYLMARVDWSLWEASFLIVLGTPTVEIVIILCPISMS